MTAQWELLESTRLGALVTLKRDGRPQLSTVSHLADAASGTIRISVTDDRAKTRNLRRDPRVSYYVSKPDGSAYAVAEGDAVLSPVAADPDDATVEALVDLYRRISGEHPDWADYRRAMVADRRVELRIEVTRTYGWG